MRAAQPVEESPRGPHGHPVSPHVEALALHEAWHAGWTAATAHAARQVELVPPGDWQRLWWRVNATATRAVAVFVCPSHWAFGVQAGGGVASLLLGPIAFVAAFITDAAQTRQPRGSNTDGEAGAERAPPHSQEVAS